MNVLAWLEADMARHMLVEFPIAFASGAAFAHLAPARIDAALANVDRLGLTGWLFAGLVAAFWMIPAALDAAIAHPAVNAAKLMSLLAAGFMLHGSMRRSPMALEAFFVGNFAWMAATVGLLYQDAEARLCLSYLADSQQRAGRGLVLGAVAIPVAWYALRGPRQVREQRSPR